MSDKKIYKIISKREDGEELFRVLEENKIEFRLVNNAFEVDTTFNGHSYHSDIQIFLFPADFERVDFLMANLAKSQLDLTDQSHYLFRFTTPELVDILRKKDEWSPYDYQFAKALLIQRGEDVSDGRIKALNEERIRELSKGDEGPDFQLVVGYVGAIMGGILGVLIGWYLWKSKKTLPNGEVVATNSLHQQQHGKIIFSIGVVIWILIAILWFWILVNR